MTIFKLLCLLIVVVVFGGFENTGVVSMGMEEKHYFYKKREKTEAVLLTLAVLVRYRGE
ncbi:MAG: hypothetical protein ACI308_02075 [Muribaculaceae bacterium]